MKKLNKKGQAVGFTISDLGTIAIALVVAVIILGLGATILTEIQNTQTKDLHAYNASSQGLSGLTTMSSFVPTIAIVAVSAIVIGIILVFFGRGRA